MKNVSWYLPVFAALPLLFAGCDGAAAPRTPTPAAPSQTIVSLTFDDGDADNFQAAALLDQYKLRATWYIPSGLVGTAGYMTWDELLALQSSGHEIGGHSLQHTRLDGLPAAELKRQVCDDRDALKSHGFQPISFAYPFGAYDPAATKMVQDCGYLSARTIGAGPDSIPPIDPYQLRAYPYIVQDTSFSKLQRYVSGVRKDGGGWLILIFHHVCAGCDYFSVPPDVFQRFIVWLAEEQAQGRVKVHTVGDIIVNGAP
ncbi:MAG TPA: polysaccharide deacetylase family protein [Anaerolineales bacterium]|nr:polysaccharide deacetylase family protein [Anaerolineales bacterium]